MVKKTKNSRRKSPKKVAKRVTSKVVHMTYKIGDRFYVGLSMHELIEMEVCFVNAGNAFLKRPGDFVADVMLDPYGYDQNGVLAVSVDIVDRITQKLATSIQNKLGKVREEDERRFDSGAV